MSKRLRLSQGVGGDAAVKKEEPIDEAVAAPPPPPRQLRATHAAHTLPAAPPPLLSREEALTLLRGVRPPSDAAAAAADVPARREAMLLFVAAMASGADALEVFRGDVVPVDYAERVGPANDFCGVAIAAARGVYDDDVDAFLRDALNTCVRCCTYNATTSGYFEIAVRALNCARKAVAIGMAAPTNAFAPLLDACPQWRNILLGDSVNFAANNDGEGAVASFPLQRSAAAIRAVALRALSELRSAAAAVGVDIQQAPPQLIAPQTPARSFDALWRAFLQFDAAAAAAATVASGVAVNYARRGGGVDGLHCDVAMLLAAMRANFGFVSVARDTAFAALQRAWPLILARQCAAFGGAGTTIDFASPFAPPLSDRSSAAAIAAARGDNTPRAAALRTVKRLQESDKDNVFLRPRFALMAPFQPSAAASSSFSALAAAQCLMLLESDVASDRAGAAPPSTAAEWQRRIVEWLEALVDDCVARLQPAHPHSVLVCRLRQEFVRFAREEGLR